MRIMMRVKNVSTRDNQSWTETFNSGTVDCLAEAPAGQTPTSYAEIVVGHWNDTLKPHEKERVVLSAREVSY